MVALMTFVLLVPTMMVAVLVSGLSRRGDVVSDEAGANLGGLLVADGIDVPVEVDQHRTAA
ncbi:hypothetical protein GCM10009795_026760 [Nocardioides hankookensis]